MRKWMHPLTGLFLVTAALLATAQTAKIAPPNPKTASVAITAEDIRSLREALAAQQQQIQELQKELRARDEATRQAIDALKRSQISSQENTAQTASVHGAATEVSTSVHTNNADVQDGKASPPNAAPSAPEDAKRILAAEQTLGRFRWSGDIRVRGEGFYQNYTGCGGPCTDRWRARIRVRVGLDGKLGEDFLGGIALASGTLANGNPTFTDPTSPNETLTSFFERKAIGVDRAYITWQPQSAKWLTATGGKFAYNWQKTAPAWDSDINPEGFTLKASRDFTHQVLKNVTLQPLLLMYQEVGGGPDSNAVGGQFLARLQFGSNVTLTPSYMVLNWNGSDAVAQAAFPVTLPDPNTTAVGTPTPTPTAQPARVINGNAMTNATTIVGAGAAQRRAFVSDFMYSDLVVNLGIKTPWARFPIAAIGEYEKNLRARVAGDSMYYFETAVGQTRNRNDFQFGYSYAHIDQDALISQFAESDYRAPTNVQNHRVFLNWALTPFVTANYSLFIGRTLDTSLQNAVRTPGIVAGAPEPWLKRMQIDLVYKF